MDDAAFLEAILADADSDTPRLVYADWLDERGDPRGEFIRVQCELEADRQDAMWPASGVESQRHTVLVQRESRLLAVHAADWAAALRPLLGAGFRPYFRRGFVDWLELTLREFLTKADEVFRLTPLAGVTLKIDAVTRTNSKRTAGPDWLELLREVVHSPWMSRLRDVHLAGNGLDNRAVRILAGAPNVAGLRRLDLCGNDLTMAGVQALAKSKHLTALRKLGLSANNRLGRYTDPGGRRGRGSAGSLWEFDERLIGLFPPQVKIY